MSNAFKKFMNEQKEKTEEDILLEGAITDIVKSAKDRLKTIIGKELPVKGDTKTDSLTYNASDSDVDRLKQVVKTDNDKRIMDFIDELISLRMLKMKFELGFSE